MGTSCREPTTSMDFMAPSPRRRAAPNSSHTPEESHLGPLITITAVPEPSTLLMMGLGVSALAGARLLRRIGG